MQIKQIFAKDIARPINGVVKADQLDESIVWQELDEYVITQELGSHLRKFLSAYLASIDNASAPVLASRIGIWISGFFGSGKSHFLKILSYLLENRKAHEPDTGREKKATDFFAEKIADPMLLGDIKRIAGVDTDVILFNIDSRADATDGRTALLTTFWRIFNQHLGFCGDSLALAEMERYLTRKGRFDAFKKEFQRIYGQPWEQERDAYILIKDKIVQALSLALENDEITAGKWFDQITTDFTLSVENFAKRVNEYLNTRSASYRLVFLVDEMGQFIGDDTHLMLNLQTLVEDLGRTCQGRAWVVVTAQEDIDAVIGYLNAAKSNDFSKITGRFNTRLSLSSTNTDEVIQSRLLEKSNEAEAELTTLFVEKGDIIKNQLSFTHDSSTMYNFANSGDFVTNYPFAPYHFQLLQKIFESIRRAGATGLHLAKGERSLLDAFQSAANNISDRQVSALAPLYEFYPCIESFLDTAVKRSIDQARTHPGLAPPFDICVLQTLFLIRYVDIIKPNVDNLVTLCIDQVDADRLALKTEIEGALGRLEKETLISRNGDLYFFLTNEEREVSREIKNTQIPASAEVELLGDIIFDDILKSRTKHRYASFKRDYPFNRICDSRIWGKELQDEIGIEIISPLNDEYSLFTPPKCNFYSANQEGFVVIRIDDDKDMTGSLRLYLQTDKYIKDKSNAAASNALKEILSKRAGENRDRRKRLVSKIAQLIADADFYALGKPISVKGQTAATAVEEALNYVVENTFSKFHYLASVVEDPVKEIKTILQADDTTQHQLKLDIEEQPPQDIQEIATFIDLKSRSNHAIMLDELVAHFSKKPYGWPEYQVVILVAKYFMAGNISLAAEGGKLAPKDAMAPLSKTSQWKQVGIVKRKKISGEEIANARKLAKDLFGSIAPEHQDKLAGFIREGLGKWRSQVEKYKPLADTGNYPGQKEINDILAFINKLAGIHDSYELIRTFNEITPNLRDAADDLHELNDFYTHQRPAWERLRSAMARFAPNKSLLSKNEAAAKALRRMEEILNAPAPYGMLKDADDLISAVEAINTSLVEKQREKTAQEIEGWIKKVKTELDDAEANNDLRNSALYPFQQIRKKLDHEASIPQIAYAVNEAQEAFEIALEKIEDAKPQDGEKKPAKQTKTISPASFVNKTWIETEKDVEDFIKQLRDALLKSINQNTRIRIK
jgi:hypothetical protein